MYYCVSGRKMGILGIGSVFTSIQMMNSNNTTSIFYAE